MSDLKTTSSSSSFLAAVEHRISCYSLTKASPISDTRIQEIVTAAVKHAPSAFNVQSARAVILVKGQHDRLWDVGDACVQKAMAPAYPALKPRIEGFRAAYATVMWFEDQAALDVLREKNPGVKHVVEQWSEHSNGMHQFIAWTALELEGLGCSLQHYNFMPEFCDEVRKEWNVPESWTLQSQLVIGSPENGLVRSRERTYLPLEDRVKIHGA